MAKEYAIKFYKSKQWIKCREGYIRSVNGLCESCLKENRIEPGEIVHHKILLTATNINNPEISLNWNNLEYNCRQCHSNHHSSGNKAIQDGYCFDDEGNYTKR